MVYTILDADGAVKCHSSIPFAGYSYEILQQMATNGYSMQVNGKKAKFPTKAEWQETTTEFKKNKK